MDVRPGGELQRGSGRRERLEALARDALRDAEPLAEAGGGEAGGPRFAQEEIGDPCFVAGGEKSERLGQLLRPERLLPDPRPPGVENPPATESLDGRGAPEDEAVPRARRKGRFEDELGEVSGTGGQFFRLGPAGAGDEMDLSGDVGRAVMDADAGAVGERRGDFGKEGRLDREERRGAKSVLRHERLPAPELGPVDPREVQARPLSREGLAALLAMDLDAPDAHLAPVRKKRQPVVDRDPPAVERPGHDGAEALHREGAVEEEAREAAVPGRPVEAPRRLGERALKFRNPRSRHGRDGEDGSLF